MNWRVGLLLLAAAAVAVGPHTAPPAFAAETQPPKAPAPSPEVRAAAAEAAKAQDWDRVSAFLASVTPESSPGTHILAGDLLFAMGRPEPAYAEHQAAAQGLLADQARLEATIDLLASRRFPEACASWAKIPGSFLRKSSSPALDAYMKIRCGQPSKGLDVLDRVFREGHSTAEEVLATVFSEQQRFSVYRWTLSKSPEAAAGAGAAAGSAAAADPTGRAMSELLLCGDFSNPWQPVHHERDAVRTLGALLAARSGDCPLRGRAAIAEMLAVGGSSSNQPGPADLAKARAFISGAFETGPACEEEAVAHYAYLDLTTGDDLKPLIAVLEASVKKFPRSAALQRYLMDRYREVGAERAHRDLLESMVVSFPDDPFAYGRLAILAAGDGKVPDGLAVLGRGLTRRPDSLPLNYMKALFLMNQKEYKLAVDPSVRLLAGLLETQNYHHGWEAGMAMLRGALDAKSPLPPGTAWPQVLGQLENFGLAAQAALFRSNYGCFSSGGGAVAVPDEWFQPEVVERAVREAQARASVSK